MDEVDQWISHLSQCKQLTEPDIKRLCEKASCRAASTKRPECLLLLLLERVQHLCARAVASACAYRVNGARASPLPRPARASQAGEGRGRRRRAWRKGH